MEDLFKKDNIFFQDSIDNWENAIVTALDPLVSQGYCEPRYVDGIFENTKKYGPYYVLCENLALIHGSMDQGAIKTQMAVTILNNPVKFKEGGHDVRVLIALVASDSKSHLKIIQSIGSIFSNENRVNELLATTSKDEVYNIFLKSLDD